MPKIKGLDKHPAPFLIQYPMKTDVNVALDQGLKNAYCQLVR
jgi:hypothetical protein